VRSGLLFRKLQMSLKVRILARFSVKGCDLHRHSEIWEVNAGHGRRKAVWVHNEVCPVRSSMNTHTYIYIWK
jgi:hypothetical protein